MFHLDYETLFYGFMDLFKLIGNWFSSGIFLLNNINLLMQLVNKNSVFLKN